MTRTRSSSVNIPCSSRMRNGTRQQTMRSLSMQKMRIKKPRKRIQSCEQGMVRDGATNALPLHMNPGSEYLADLQVNSSTRLQESDNESLEDEELPEVKFNSTTAKTKVKELVPGTMVWAKSPCWPHWPAVLIKVISNDKNAWVDYFDKYSQRAKVSLRSMAPFFGPLRSQFIETGKASKNSDDFTAALERAEDYLIKQGLGKSPESTTNVPSSSDVNSVSPMSMSLLHETTDSVPDDAQPPAALLTSSSYIMSSDEELLIGHPVVQNRCIKEDLELKERRRVWKYTENRLLKYIQRDITKNHLLAIYHGKTNSERQRLFKSRRARDRQKLRLMAGVGPITDEKLESELTCFLKDLYVEHCMECKEDLPNISFITEVWLPEAIIFAIQKTRRVGRQNAEKLFHSEGVQSLVDLGEDMPVVPSIVNQTLDEI